MVYIALITAFVLIGLDQIFKYLVMTNIPLYTSIPFIRIGDTQIINLTYVQNRGAAFSFLEDKLVFLIIVTSIFILIGLYLLLSKKIKGSFYIWTISLMLAGGIGNLIDRIFRGDRLFDGFVIDYLEVKIFKFAVFNFADICVVIGAVLFLIYTIFTDVKKSKKDLNPDGNI